MAKKRRRRPARPAGTTPPATSRPPLAAETDPVGEAGESREHDQAVATNAVEPATAAEGSAERRIDRPPLPGGRLSERMRAASPYPPLLRSVGTSVLTVTGSLSILLTGLLFVGALWLALLAAGMEVFPSTFVEALAFPPFSSYLIDTFVPTQIFGLTAAALLGTLVISFVRAAVWAALTGMLLEAFEFGEITMVGVLQGLRAFPAVLAYMLVNVLAIVASNLILPVILGAIGQLALAVVLFGSIYLLPFSAAAAIRQNLRAGEAMRRSARAARLPGPRHIAAVIMYFFIAILMLTFMPGRSIVTANARLVEWVWILGATVVQLVFLGVFCERWLVVESIVPTAAPPRAARAARASRARTR